MHEIKETAGVVVAAETQAMVAAIDSAMITQARLCASVVEAAADAKMPLSSTQKLVQSISDGMGALAQSRANLATAAKELAFIKSRSNLDVFDWGCPDPDEFWRTSGNAGKEPARAQETAQA